MEKPIKFKPSGQKTPETWVPKDYPDYTCGQTGPEKTRQHREEVHRRQQAYYNQHPDQQLPTQTATFMIAPQPSTPTTSTTSTIPSQMAFEAYNPSAVQTTSSRRQKIPVKQQKKKTAPKSADPTTKPTGTRKRARAEKDSVGGPTNRRKTMNRTQPRLPAGVTNVNIYFDKAAYESFRDSETPYGMVSVFVTVAGDADGQREATLTFGPGLTSLLQMMPADFNELPEDQFAVFAEGSIVCPEEVLHLRVPLETSTAASKPKSRRFVHTMSLRVASAAEASAVFKAALAKHRRGLKVGKDNQVPLLESSSQPLSAGPSESLNDAHAEGVVDAIPDPSGASSLTDATAAEPYSVTEGAGDSVVLALGDAIQGAAQESHLAEDNPHSHRGSDDGHVTDDASAWAEFLGLTSSPSETNSGSSSAATIGTPDFLWELPAALSDFEPMLTPGSSFLPAFDEHRWEDENDPAFLSEYNKYNPKGLFVDPAAIFTPFD